MGVSTSSQANTCTAYRAMCLTLNMKLLQFSEMAVTVFQPKLPNSPEDLILHRNRFIDAT
jgi:hypothetical protein